MQNYYYNWLCLFYIADLYFIFNIIKFHPKYFLKCINRNHNQKRVFIASILKIFGWKFHRVYI
jgi:hypothetical protein